MAYSKYHDEWENYPESEATPVSAAALDHIEGGIVDAASTADDAAAAASSAASAASSAQSTADSAADDLANLGIGGVSGLESRLAAIEGRLDALENGD